MPTLVRNTNTCWSLFPQGTQAVSPTTTPSRKIDIDEIQIEMPSDLSGEERYQKLLLLQSVFQKRKPSFEILRHGVQFVTSSNERWELIASQVNKGLVSSLIQKINFFKVVEPPKKLAMIFQRHTSSLCSKKIAKKALEVLDDQTVPPLPVIRQQFDPEETLSKRLLHPLFSDPFTTLATDAFQTNEENFVMEAEHKSSFRYVFENGMLRLEKNIPNEELPPPSPPPSPPVASRPSPQVHEGSSQEICTLVPFKSSIIDVSKENDGSGFMSARRQQQEANRYVVKLFVKFLREEYGHWIIGFLKHTYKLDFLKMIEEGSPLYPDHIFKANIGANNIEFGNVCALIETLKMTQGKLEQNREALEKPFEECIDMETVGTPGFLSIRETRKLIEQTKAFFHLERPVLAIDVLRYIQEILPATTQELETLSPDKMNALIDLLVSTNDELDRAFTGRKIYHTPIFGYHTMGNKDIENPCRDLFELLHIFQQLRKEDWEGYYELLAHVVAKKSLFRKNIDGTGWHVGLLIPGPTRNGEKTWYCNRSFLDDSRGNVSYTLEPVTTAYSIQSDVIAGQRKLLPFIKLFRSTASDKSALNHVDSIAADLNYKGSPGSLDPTKSYPYERSTFEARTLPMWMGYTLLSILYKDTPPSSYSTWMAQAVSLFKEYRTADKKEAKISQEEIRALDLLLKEKKYREILSYLVKKGDELGESPDQKIEQDIAFVGHSLGGALAQDAVYQFYTKTKRIPLPEMHVTCFTSHPPGIDNNKNADFIHLGQEHHEMLRALNIRFDISHQFEAGDFVPQSGGSHLGSLPYPYEKSKNTQPSTQAWKRFRAHIFTPLPSAKSLEMEAPTHGRRIHGDSIVDRDYALTEVTEKQLSDFDHARILRDRAWGFSVAKSPQLTENLRKIFGRGYHKLWYTREDKKNGPGFGDRDKNGVWYMHFCQRRALEQLLSKVN